MSENYCHTFRRVHSAKYQQWCWENTKAALSKSTFWRLYTYASQDVSILSIYPNAKINLNASFELWMDLRECMPALHKTQPLCNSEIARDLLQPDFFAGLGQSGSLGLQLLEIFELQWPRQQKLWKISSTWKSACSSACFTAVWCHAANLISVIIENKSIYLIVYFLFFIDYVITIFSIFPLYPPSTLPPNPPASPLPT